MFQWAKKYAPSFNSWAIFRAFKAYKNELEGKQNIEKVVQTEEDKIETPSSIQKYFDRLYFSIITACLLGYGDIYPTTNVAKILTAIQSLLTVCLILY